MEKLTPEKAKWLAERYYKGMEKRDPSMARIFYTEDFVLQDDGAVDLVKGIKEAEAFLQNMYNTWPNLKFDLLKEPCIGIDGVTVAFLVRATSSRKSRRKFTGPTAQWEFASFYTVDLEQEKFCAGRCCFNIEQNIRDIAGVRVICSFESDVYRMADHFLMQDDITLLEKKDYIANPKENGYRSLHLIVSVPIFTEKGKVDVPVEVQMRTIAMDFWASLEHKIRYKKNIPEELRNELSECLADCAKRSHQLDIEFQGGSEKARNAVY